MVSRDGQIASRNDNFNNNKTPVNKNTSQEDVLPSSDAKRSIAASQDGTTPS